MDVYTQWQQRGNTPQPFNSGAGLNYLEGLAGSFLHGMGPGMLGVKPGGALQAWQHENPWATLGAEVGGMMVPYAGWAKASTSVPRLGDAIRRIEGSSSGPVARGFAKEVVRFAPFEAGRVAGGALIGEDVAAAVGGQYVGVWDQMGEAGLNTALAGGFGAAGALLSGAGQAVMKRRGITPGADLGAPLQHQIRQVREKIASGALPENSIPLAEAGINRLQRQVWDESAPVFAKDPEGVDAAVVERLFRARSKGMEGSKLLPGKVFEDTAHVQDFLQRAGVGPDFAAYARYPRYVRVAQPAAERKMTEALTAMKEADGLRYVYDKADGTFIMAKRLSADETLIWKTDTPGKFAPGAASWAEAMGRRVQAFGREDLGTLSNSGSALLDEGLRLNQVLPYVDYRAMGVASGTAARLTSSIAKATKLDSFADKGEGVRRLHVFMKGYLSPAQHQFGGNPLANRTRELVKSVKDHAEYLAQKMVLGEPTPRAGSLYSQSLRGTQFAQPGTVAAMARGLEKNPAAWQAVLRTIYSGEGVQGGIARHGLTPEGARFLEKLKLLDEELAGSVIGAQKAAGLKGKELFRPKQDHFMLSHTWRGTWRVPVYDDKGRLVWVAGGVQRGEALKAAKAQVDRAQEAGFRWRARDAREAGFDEEMEFLKKLAVGSRDFRHALAQNSKGFSKVQPGTFKKREDVGGFEQVVSADDLIKTLVGHARRYRLYESRLASELLVKKDMMRLATEDPEVFEQLSKRLKLMYGEVGPFSQSIDKAADTLLSPVLGKNSATTIGNSFNKYMYRIALGFWNVGYNVSNLVTFAQTAFPMMSLLASAPPDRLARYMSWRPMLRGDEARGFGFMDMMKVTGQSFKEMGKPDAALQAAYHRAAAEGVVDPRFIDEVVGINALNKNKLREALKADEPVSEFLRIMADTLPAASEKLARGHSFAMGHIFFRDVFNVKDPELLYRMSKEFVEKTQFLYSTGDRAQIITGPIGSQIGLFNNWIMHYIGWMFNYATEGVKYGNWSPFLYMMGGSAAIGGIGGSVALSGMDRLAQTLGKDSLMHATYERFGQAGPEGRESVLADTMYYGLPGFFGFSIQNTVAMPFSHPIDDVQFMFSAASWQQGRAMGEAMGAAWDQWKATGQHPAQSEHVRDMLMRGFAPKSLNRSIQGVQALVEEELRSPRTGYPEVTGMSTMESLWQMANLTPTRVAALREARATLFEDQAAMQAQVQAFGKTYAEMSRAGDWRGVRELLYRAQLQGANIDSVIKSGEARLAKFNESAIERQFSEEALLRWRGTGLI